MEWISLKAELVQATGLQRDALHIYGAVLLQALCALLLRRTLAHPLPWLVALIASVANEWTDLTAETWPGDFRTMQYWESIHDIVNTVALPTVLLIAVRYVPRLFTKPAALASSEAVPEPEDSASQA